MNRSSFSTSPFLSVISSETVSISSINSISAITRGFLINEYFKSLGLNSSVLRILVWPSVSKILLIREVFSSNFWNIKISALSIINGLTIRTFLNALSCLQIRPSNCWISVGLNERKQLNNVLEYSCKLIPSRIVALPIKILHLSSLESGSNSSVFLLNLLPRNKFLTYSFASSSLMPFSIGSLTSELIIPTSCGLNPKFSIRYSRIKVKNLTPLSL